MIYPVATMENNTKTSKRFYVFCGSPKIDYGIVNVDVKVGFKSWIWQKSAKHPQPKGTCYTGDG